MNINQTDLRSGMLFIINLQVRLIMPQGKCFVFQIFQ